ncbi:MAG: rhomboid family intramembrane serine protease [Acidimicrobiia bacterium]|nr:rhomboid family intramembrane serine protease [Acidimicrobiia bacterium]
MIPLRDAIPSRTTPFITMTVIVMNALAWVYAVSLSPRDLESFVRSYGVVPARLEFSTLLSSMFLHGGWAHVIGNMWYLWIFGDNVEDRMGHARFFVFYALCGIGAAMGHVLLEPKSTVPTIGASGAIAGVMGAYFVPYPQSRVLTLVPFMLFWDVIEVPALVFLGLWFLFQLLSAGASAVSTTAAVSGGIALAAHVAGFVLGVIGVYVFKKRQPPVEWLYSP